MNILYSTEASLKYFATKMVECFWQRMLVKYVLYYSTFLKSLRVNLLPPDWLPPTSYVYMRLHDGFLQIIVDCLDRRPLLSNCASNFVPLELEDSIDDAISHPILDISNALT